VDLAIDGEPRTLPAGLDVSAYRIVQEALTNTVKHSTARLVGVRLRFTGHELCIEVQDVGPARESSTTTGGHGLVGMRERVALFGGTLQVGPCGRGFSVVARLPVDGAAR
jgi:signal transduction histidine kinase